MFTNRGFFEVMLMGEGNVVCMLIFLSDCGNFIIKGDAVIRGIVGVRVFGEHGVGLVVVIVLDGI